ncbi:MAG: hypothetical protein Q9225_002077 [Loekoesia sp. 1 TL-2023]
MDRPPRIPERTSSKSPTKGRSISPRKRFRELENERRNVNDQAKRAKKKVRLAVSFDAEYWAARLDLTNHQLRATRLTKKMSIEELNTSTDVFLASEEGTKLLLQESCLEMESKMFEEQLRLMKNSDKSFRLRKCFVELFMGAPTGLGLSNPRGQRDNSLQSQFRADLIERMESRSPNPKSTALWCPVSGTYWPESSIRAGHLFPSRCGENYMDAIFGSARDENGVSELFKAENGMLWSKEVEDRFEAGHFVIVPDVADDPTPQQIKFWETANVKEYKIRVLNPGAKSMNQTIFPTDTEWKDLDGKRVQFKGSFRPRARYLYFAYCAAMLRRSFTGKHLEVSRSELRKRFWGTPGKYLRESMLLGFVEQMGHDYDHLLEGAIEEDNPVLDVRATDAAVKRIKDSLEDEDGDKDEEDEEDEDDSDEEEGEE